MTDTWLFLIRFYGPIALAIFITVIALGIRNNKDVPAPNDAQVSLSLFSVISFSIPMPERFRTARITRLLLYTVAGCLLIAALGTDFSLYFPQKLKMNVYFDSEGIERELRGFSDAELSQLLVDRTQWARLQLQYENDVKLNLAAERLNRYGQSTVDTAGMTHENVHAVGQTTFVTKRTGFLSYRIVEAIGELTNTADVPGRRLIPFRSSLVLRDSPFNFLKPRLWDLVSEHTITIRPEFKQIFADDASPASVAPFDHTVIGLTKVRILPVPDFGATVYLWKQPAGRAVPIAYGIYYE